MNQIRTDSNSTAGNSTPSVQGTGALGWRPLAPSCADDLVSRRLGRWFRHFWMRSKQVRARESVAADMFVPTLTSLEPRIVLNATAELSAAAGLLITGDGADDFVRINSVDGGNSIQLTDLGGNIIPIVGHTGGTTGNETDPLAIADINGGAVSVDLGGGDDVLEIELPDGINLDVIDGAGDDRVDVDVQPNASPSPPTLLQIDSETIDFGPSGSLIQFANRDVQLTGEVVIGSGSPSVVTQVEVGTGTLQVDGSLFLSGSVRMTGTSGDVMLDNAVVSALSTDDSLFFDFDAGADSQIRLGQFDDSAGHFVDELRIDAATSLSVVDEITISDSLTIESTNEVDLDANVQASEIDVAAQTISLTGQIVTDSGPVVLVASDQLTLAGDIDATGGGVLGGVTLGGTAIELQDVSLWTAGGNVTINGDVSIDGLAEIDSASGAAVAVGGDVSWTGMIGSDAGIRSGSLSVDAVGTSGGGEVEFNSSIGGVAEGDALDLLSLTVSAGDLTMADVGVDGGGVLLSAVQIDLAGDRIRSSDVSSTGNARIELIGDAVFRLMDTQVVSDGNVLLDGSHQTLGVNDDVTLSSEADVIVRGEFVGGNEVSVNAQQTALIDAELSGWTRITVSGALGIRVVAAAMDAADSIAFENDVNFEADTQVTSADARFEGSVDVSDSFVVDLNAVMIDSIGQTAIEKQGLGELVLSGTNTSATDLVVRTGTLRVDGSVDAAAGVLVLSDGVLAGSGTIGGQVSLDGGTLAPNEFVSGGATGQLRIGSLATSADPTYQVHVDGDVVGASLDSVLVDTGPIDLDGMLLELDLSVTLPGDTQLTIVQNDTLVDVSGRFFASFDEDGNALATPRELFEGARVLNQFGIGPGAVPAYITYFGGDGNDVTIVTAGERIQAVDDVTIVTRVGVDLQIRTGATFSDAQNATPTVRPIAGLNGNQLVLQPTVSAAELYIDINGFVDTQPDPLHFAADIVFDVAPVGGAGRVALVDSDPGTVDSPDRFRAVYDTANDLGLVFDHDVLVASDYQVVMTGVDDVDLELPSDVFDFELTVQNDQATVDADSDPDYSELGLTTLGETSSFRFQHPGELFSLDGRQGNDVLMFDQFGAGFVAVPDVAGGNGDDQLFWNADVQVGAGAPGSDFALSAESISIAGDLTLVGGGSIRIEADDQLTLTSDLDATAGQIQIESNDVTSDLALGSLSSAASGDAISLHGGGFLIGDINATDGTLVLGSAGGLGSIESVSQVFGSEVLANRVTSESTGSLSLDSSLNQIDEIDLIADGAVMVLDGADDLLVSVAAGSSVDIQAAGDLTVDSVSADANAARLVAAGNILGLSGQTGLHLAADSIELLAGIPFPGQPTLPVAVAGIGTAVVPIRVGAAQVFSASTASTDGSVFIVSPAIPLSNNPTGQLPIGLVDAGAGTINLDAAEINDAFSSSDVDLIGSRISLTADSGIGSQRTLTLTGVDGIEAVTTIGTIQLDLIADRTVSLDRVITGGGAGAEILVQHSGDERLSIVEVINEDGDVTVTTELGSIDILSNVAGDSLGAGGDGDMRIVTLAGEADLTVRGSVSSDTGAVTLDTERNLVFTPAGTLVSIDGAVVLSAGKDPTLVNSTLALLDGSIVDAGAGTVTLLAPADVFLSSVRSSSVADAITIVSQNGEVIDSGDADPDLIADQGTVRIDVAGGIGDGNPLETLVSRLFAQSRLTGSIELTEQNAIVLDDVNSRDGAIRVVASGTISANQVESQNVNSIDNASSPNADIHLETIAADSDILVHSIIARNGADVRLISGDDVFDQSGNSLLVADDLSILSANQTADSSLAIRLATNVDDLELSVTGAFRGDAQIDEVDSLRVASSDRGDDGEVVSTANGEIRISAGERILISDAALVDDLETLRGDVELIAGGDNGRIRLTAGEAIHVGDRVQAFAEQSAAESVVIDAVEIVFGSEFQIETGDEVGVARVFAPRPDVDLIDTAFYEFTSIQTNRLEQAAVNDATGVLTVDIGNEGERGLTINLDWGAETNRFQQLDGLSGDAPPLQVEHLYLEQDILDSRLNGRTSATDPLEVRFSVRHHESILVRGETVQQFPSDVELVEGELISSTDNPLTEEGPAAPILENGMARFVIPNLSIPVAFFPVRDVIPVIEQAPVIVESDTTFVVLGSGFETSEVVPSSTTGREEYFQIRVLSPDPEGEDLVPPERLPDDIISGDKLRRLFESLPDGRYDIQYVLGDGDVRSILTVDLRDGKPVLPGQELDGGVLRLVPVEPDDRNDPANDERQRQPDQETIDPDQSTSLRRTLRLDASHQEPERLAEMATMPMENDQPGRLSVAGRLRQRAIESGRFAETAGGNE